jgi:hypothetical protein
MPVICPTCQTPRAFTCGLAKTVVFRPRIIRSIPKALSQGPQRPHRADRSVTPGEAGIPKGAQG